MTLLARRNQRIAIRPGVVRRIGLLPRAAQIASIFGSVIAALSLAPLTALAQASDDPVDLAIQRLTDEKYAMAAQYLRRSLEIRPDDAVVNITAGAVALQTGELAIAQKAFEQAQRSDPKDPLAAYGLGLALLARGERSGASVCFDRAQSLGGDVSYLVTAKRYVQWLAGVQIDVAGAAFPGPLQPAQSMLSGMQSARNGSTQQAIALLESAVGALDGDPLVEMSGAPMSFDASRPIASGATRLPAGSLAVATDQGILSGSVEISPDKPSRGIAFASFEVDGQPLSIVNVWPFVYTLDTSRLSNGRHTLTVILQDGALNEVSRTNRKIRVFNSNIDPVKADDVGAARRAALWRALRLTPGRAAAYYQIGILNRRLNRTAVAYAWFARAAAIDPNYRDVRSQWAACGGSATGSEAIWGGSTAEKVVALTFDDGPKPGVTEPLLEILKQERVPATFFVIGRHVIEYPELTRQIYDAGMEIANHSYTHPNLTKLSAGDVTREVMQTQAAVQAVTGKAPRFLRPPGGNWNPKVASVVRSWGLTPCMWTVDVYGSEVIGAQQVADAVLAQVKPGSIILMHNGKVSTLQALPTIIRALRARGYAFATVDTLERRLGTLRSIVTPAEPRRE